MLSAYGELKTGKNRRIPAIVLNINLLSPWKDELWRKLKTNEEWGIHQEYWRICYLPIIVFKIRHCGTWALDRPINCTWGCRFINLSYISGLDVYSSILDSRVLLIRVSPFFMDIKASIFTFYNIKWCFGIYSFIKHIQNCCKIIYLDVK